MAALPKDIIEAVDDVDMELEPDAPRSDLSKRITVAVLGRAALALEQAGEHYAAALLQGWREQIRP
jgi:hypothetical protein